MDTNLIKPATNQNAFRFSEEIFVWETRGQMFSTEKMFARLKEEALNKRQLQTSNALEFARTAHAGQLRKKQKFSAVRQEYFSHPLLVACHMESLGITEDEMIATGLLHDVCEDCNILPESLPFSPRIRYSVDLLTKRKDTNLSKAELNRTYYERISHDRIAAVVKIIDRVNNVSTMVQVFSNAKLNEYISETEEFILPLIKTVKHTWPEYSDLCFLAKYHLTSVLEAVKILLIQEQTLCELTKDVGNNALGV